MDNIGSDAFALAFADFSGYKIVDRRGISVLRDPYTNKPHVGFYATKRVGGDIRNFDKIKLMKFATS
jgi:HK97 family phage major capsid protein